MRRSITSLAIALLAMGGAAVSTTPAAAAPPTCNAVKAVPGAGGYPLKALVYSGTGSTTCALQQGNSGAAVKELQIALNKCFYLAYDRTAKYWPLKEDGDFGDNTRKALTEAQDYFTNVPADIDGVYGPITRDLLLWRAQNHNGCWYFGTINAKGSAS
ncbi:peptidoglycan-binding protein [Actinacidiphila glaucinigra]|uniref:peptidoglycan-binding domain-containing protein n=1 Tax=Actinacidiphila glaucinigra TaxID=235986 RepID=UPI002DD7CADC|nr:peptidoglycan-binding protein [Actinacidiphila glaucinigra]WSD64751.1 peptidoglycan-binding protein [Actinacidiphila glaucinigra]